MSVPPEEAQAALARAREVAARHLEFAIIEAIPDGSYVAVAMMELAALRAADQAGRAPIASLLRALAEHLEGAA